ncbi:MAG: hypothetical protein JO244_14570 [Solirubrobacterales bacterium]|nr:hypothetical protein [Solirubrobacterales bacterium]
MELDVSFAIARERLMQLAGSGLLHRVSEDAYDLGTEGLARVGIPGLSKLVRVRARDLAVAQESVGLAIRWEATGPGGGLFPVLDADMRLVRSGERAVVLTMSGVYRPPLGAVGQALDRAILHRVAAATIRDFVAQVAAGIGDQPGGYVTVQDRPSAPELNA